ncbi:MAG: MFS transporter [Burkholderiaceae bacterium]|nr:MFS transporter [Burkholderiaceae bacterium]
MTVGTTAAGHASYDVMQAIDEGKFTPLQRMIYVLAALALVLDGFDGQMIGYAIPAIMKEWGVTRAAFSVAVASGLVGMAVGSVVAGLIADRVGRKPVLIGSIFLFGSATFLIGYATDVTSIAMIRFFAGLGIGAALPAATTLTAEFTPTRFRTIAVTTAIVCYPLGGMLAGLVAGQVLPTQGWRVFFFIGGAMPIAYAVVLIFLLRESPKYLARQSTRWEELRGLMARMAHEVAHVKEFTDGVITSVRRGSIGEVFRDGRASDSIWLWICFFMTLLSIYSAFSWLPTMLTTEGLSPALAGMGLTAYNFGGVIGAIICALAVTRYGSRKPMIFYAAMSAASALLLNVVSVTSDTQTFLLGLGLHGLFITAVQCSLYALCAHLYPTVIRVTGTASALAFGRLGAILSAFAGAAMITAGGASAYLNLLGGSMVITVLGLVMIRNHIKPAVKAE